MLNNSNDLWNPQNDAQWNQDNIKYLRDRL